MATKEIPHADIKAAKDMAIFHLSANWLIVKPLEALSYARILNSDVSSDQMGDYDKTLAYIAIFFGFRAYSALAKRTSTRFIGNCYGVDTTKTRVLSLIPYVDNSVPLVQSASFIKDKGRKIWYYTKSILSPT